MKFYSETNTYQDYLDDIETLLDDNVYQVLQSVLDPKLNCSAGTHFNTSYKYMLNNTLPRSNIVLYLPYSSIKSLLINLNTTKIIETDKCIMGLNTKNSIHVNRKLNTLYLKHTFDNNRIVYFKHNHKLFVDNKDVKKYAEFSLVNWDSMLQAIKDYNLSINNKYMVDFISTWIQYSYFQKISPGIAIKFNNPFWRENLNLLKISFTRTKTGYNQLLVKKELAYRRKNKSYIDLVLKDINLKHEDKSYVIFALSEATKLKGKTYKDINKILKYFINDNKKPLEDITYEFN